MVILAAVLAILLLIAFIRLGTIVKYSETGLTIKLLAGAFVVMTFPIKSEKGIKKKTAKGKKQKSPGTKPIESKKAASALKRYLPPAVETLKRFRIKLNIDSLTIHFLSGAEDPFDAAMNFGKISVLEGIILPFIDNNFNIKKRDVQTGISFDGGGNKIYLEAKMTLAVWQIVYIASAMLPLLKKEKTESKDGKADTYGQASN